MTSAPSFRHASRPGLEAGGEALVVRQPDDVVDAAGARDLDRLVARAVVDDQPFDRVEAVDLPREVGKDEREGLLLVEAGDLDDQLHAAGRAALRSAPTIRLRWPPSRLAPGGERRPRQRPMPAAARRPQPRRFDWRWGWPSPCCSRRSAAALGRRPRPAVRLQHRRERALRPAGDRLLRARLGPAVLRQPAGLHVPRALAAAAPGSAAASASSNAFAADPTRSGSSPASSPRCSARSRSG